MPILALAFLFLASPPDGQERSPWLLFAGKFHLLTIHFPIALLYLVPLLELVGRHKRFPHLRASVEFMLMLGLLASLFAASLGWALARNGGYSGRIVTQHMWGGLLTALACWLCWILRDHAASRRGNIVYWAALATTVALVSWTGYRGGQLTQGENHLTDGMPAALQTLLGISTDDSNATGATTTVAVVARNTFYGAHVEPIFAKNCYSCHGRNKQRGKLRLDSYKAILRGGKHGAVIKAGNIAGSELFHRINLPQTDDNAMPPSDKQRLTPDEIKTIEAWIEAGASETSPLNAVQGAPTNVAAALKEIELPEYDPSIADKSRSTHAADVAALQKRYPDLLQYESRTSAMLSLNASLAGEKFGDRDLASFKPVLEQIRTADFSGTSISDHSSDLIASMKNLRLLRLSHTRVTDDGVKRLHDLAYLQSINLLGTQVTSAMLGTIASMPKMEHLYVANTRITPASANTPTLKQKLIF
ncbi:c-type cytochrome domain-containing protein [Acidobacterium sp. S8]|uniref:c-type cytochrome domain-containing protein n=1 Tax=Acidobacterium sp. S8 TaxID=1641854 RepID=UPI00131E459A|nr:c-type cytochrome domain-containing protein [Acidobacterium sp. S8]